MTAERGNGETQNAQERPPLVITHQYVKDLSFENPSAPGLYVDPPQQGPDVNIQVNVSAHRLSERLFEVVLHVEARASAGDATLFLAELDYAGLAETGTVPDEHLQPLILIEVPRLLFPYARAIISDVTRDGGFPPLMIANVDFVDMYRRGAQQTETPAQQPA